MRKISPLTPAVFAALASLSAAAFAASPAGAPPSVANLRCEYKVDPLGIDVAQPRLSWQLRSDARGVVQSAYQLEVTRDGRTVWDTGKVASDRSVLVPYGGPALESSGRYTWRVRVWDGGGKPSAWSAPGHWEMGLLSSGDWKARWIEAAQDEDAKTSQPAPMLRGTFAVKGKVRSARAYVTSLGLYELEINGKRVGDQLFTPGWTSYHQRLQYQTYDVTAPPARRRERDRRDARRRLVPRLPRLEGQADRLRGPPRAAVPAADRVRGRADGDRGHGRDLEVDHGADPVVGHLQRTRPTTRGSSVPAGAPPATGRRLGARASW